MEATVAKNPKYQIDIEGELYPWDAAIITVEQLRQLAGYPPGTEMIEVDLDTNTERTLTDGEVITVEPGKGFGKKILFKRG
jgi:Multiubiquitin